MKLKTEMQDGCVHMSGCRVDENAIEGWQAERLVSDAAAAHALMMAMKEYTHPVHAAVVAMVLQRASELMAQWGFDTGEDA